MCKIKPFIAICSLLGLMIVFSLTAVSAWAFKNNPPGPKGGKGTNWNNPPGPEGGPGASPKEVDSNKWWQSKVAYHKLEREELRTKLEKLKEYRSELMASGADGDLIAEINDEIEDVEEALFR
ncbi:MAG: hypothetical protein JW893_09725 [Candidatus Omnitrophica bacterium]|nr:hypothetical protein [Candidatus Omnitrophota bacterium]